MARKLLFLMGIIAAHGALAAGLASGSSSPRAAKVSDTCVQPPEAPLHFAPPRELLAYVVAPHSGESEVGHP
jgi:hypothetical protein